MSINRDTKFVDRGLVRVIKNRTMADHYADKMVQYGEDSSIGRMYKSLLVRELVTKNQKVA